MSTFFCVFVADGDCCFLPFTVSTSSYWWCVVWDMQVAEYIKQCKTPEEIRQRFNIPNDFTPEEEEEVRKENAWCEEAPS